MLEDEINAVSLLSSVEKAGYGPVYFAQFRSLYKRRNGIDLSRLSTIKRPDTVLQAGHPSHGSHACPNAGQRFCIID